jgi:multiple sugar transport system permease protein
MVKAKNKKRALLREEITAGIVFALPWIIGFLLFTIYPILSSLYYSFTDYNSYVVTRLGFFNYETAFRDVFFSDGFRNTLYFVALNVPISTVLGVLMAQLLSSRTFGLKVYRTIYYLPNVVSIIAATFMWQWLFNETFGPINAFLQIFGIEGPGWLTDPSWVKPALLIMSAWGVGGTIILYLATMTNVPAELYEAAEIDGAGGFAKFIRITIPAISPIISFNVLMGIIGGFQYFLPAYIMTAGGPGRTSFFLGQVIYENAFRQNAMGYASAISWILLIVILCFTLIYLKLSKRFVFYLGEK